MHVIVAVRIDEIEIRGLRQQQPSGSTIHVICLYFSKEQDWFSEEGRRQSMEYAVAPSAVL